MSKSKGPGTSLALFHPLSFPIKYGVLRLLLILHGGLLAGIPVSQESMNRREAELVLSTQFKHRLIIKAPYSHYFLILSIYQGGATLPAIPAIGGAPLSNPHGPLDAPLLPGFFCWAGQPLRLTLPRGLERHRHVQYDTMVIAASGAIYIPGGMALALTEVQLRQPRRTSRKTASTSALLDATVS